jgi:ribosomal protein L39E
MVYQMPPKTAVRSEVAKSRTKAAQRKLSYQSLIDEKREIPAWIDAMLRKAVQPDPYRRYDELSEFVYDLRHPNKVLLERENHAAAGSQSSAFLEMRLFHPDHYYCHIVV